MLRNNVELNRLSQGMVQLKAPVNKTIRLRIL